MGDARDPGGDDGTPAHETAVARRAGVERQPPHGRADPVCADDEVVAARCAVGELGPDRIALLHERREPDAEPVHHWRRGGLQDAEQTAPGDAQAGADAVPQRGQVGAAQHGAVGVAERPARHDGGARVEIPADAEPAQRAHPIGVQDDPGTVGGPLRAGLDQLGPSAFAREGDRGGQAGDAAADDEDAQVMHGRSVARPSCPVRPWTTKPSY